MINALSIYLKTIFFGAHLFELIVIKRIKATKMPDRFSRKITHFLSKLITKTLLFLLFNLVPSFNWEFITPFPQDLALN